MTRRALLVGVGNYGRYARALTAPVGELQRWNQLLRRRPYSFDPQQIRILADAQATRANVLDGLEWLLDGAQPGDQLIFNFIGHGTVARGRDPNDAEQSLIAYSENGGLAAAAVTESEVEAVFLRKRPPHGTVITICLDTCFAANYGDPTLFRAAATDAATDTTTHAIPLFVPIIDSGKGPAGGDVFGSGRRLVHFGTFILAAAGPTETAYEISDGRQRRMLFTMRLLAWLQRTQDTYDGIIRNINPLHPVLRQQASLRGNASHANERFPGEPAVQNAKAGEGVVPEPVDPKASVGLSQAELGRSYVDIDVLGIGCFVNPRPDTVGLWKVRVVFPYDAGEYVSGDNRHKACLEIQARDIVESLGSEPTRRYTRAGVEWYRWDLDAHTVSVEIGDPDDSFERGAAFLQYVPRITDMANELRPRNPRRECFSETPLPGPFAAFLDIPNGSVEVGPFNENQVAYIRPQSNVVERKAEFTPISVRVNVPVITDFPEIVLRTFPYNTEEARISVRSGAAILMANAREIDISGDGGGDPVPPEQFRLYYKLSNYIHDDLPLPAVIGIPIDDCTVTDWP
jgi:hypothetical protein